jgi:amidase
MSALDYLEVRRVAHRVRLAMAQEFAAFDLIMTPSTATLPPPRGLIDSNAPDFDFERWAAVSYGFAPFSEVFNVTGQPAASLPMFESDSRACRSASSWSAGRTRITCCCASPQTSSG